MGHVLIVTLGPVQDFIAAARRSRDLWFGSWLLSDLSKATAEAMALECGVESLVFPGVKDLSELRSDRLSVANKIVVRVPEGKDPATVAEQGREGMKTRLEGHRKEAFARIEREYFEEPTAIAQVDDLIEYSWVSAPEHGSDGYADARRRAEALLAQRKNTRLWNPVAWGKDVPKSSIDGERESVLHESLFDNLTPEQIRVGYGVGPAERLCGVGLLKRHGRHPNPNNKYTHRFLSTGHLAAWPVYKRAEGLKGDPDLADLWSRYLKVLAAGGVILNEQTIVQGGGWMHPVFGAYDGSLLFENRLPELFEEVTDENRRKAAVQEARKALAAVLERVGVTTPVPYYAILVADGDRMGRAIERQTGFREHRELSRVLDGFAQSARSLVENEHGGELIYSGGDDVLAFVPLHRAVACAFDLADSFAKRLKGFPTDGEGGTPTLSAGIGISHFMEPLRRALSTARKAEKLAKRDRNSLAVIVDKRSGPPVSVVGPWGALDRQLTDYARMHRKEIDQIPDGAAYELRELARLLDGAEGESKESLEKLVRKEAERIFRRKQPEHGAQQKIEKEVLERLLADLAGMPLRDLADRLIVSRLLAQAADEANAPLEESQP